MLAAPILAGSTQQWVRRGPSVVKTPKKWPGPGCITALTVIFTQRAAAALGLDTGPKGLAR